MSLLKNLVPSGLLLSALLGASTALAGAPTQELLTVTSDARPGKVYKISVTLDDQGDITGIDYLGSSSQHWDLSHLQAGVVILQDSGRDVVTLSAAKVTGKDGGRVRLRYLVSGIDNSMANFEYDIVRTAEGWANFTVREQGQKAFRSLFLKKNSFFGKTIGISKIIPQ